MKKIIIMLLSATVVFGGSAYANRRVEQGIHLPAPAADFSDTFNDDLSFWNVEVENGSNWHIANDGENNYLTSGAVDTWNAEQETLIVMNEEIESDKYSVSINASDKRYGAMASLVFKYTSPQHYYSLRMLNIENVDYIGFYRRNGVTLWQEENLTLVEFPGGTRTPGKSFEIKVEVDGSAFKAYVDGNLITEYTEDKEYFTGNRAGLFQSYGDPSYDDFKIFVFDDENESSVDEEYVFNRQLLHTLGFLWEASETGNSDALLTNTQFDYFMSRLCSAPPEGRVGEYADFDYVTESFLRALGYDKISPSSAYYNAKDELIKNVTSSECKITLKDFMQMAVNSFEIDVVKRIYGNNENYVIGKELNILNVYHNIYSDTAVLSDNGRTSLSGRSEVAKGEIAFDNGFVADAGDTDAANYIGYRMKYYYEDDHTPKLLFYSLELDDELFLYADEIVAYANDTLSYKLRNTDKVKKVKIPTDAMCIYNGMAVTNTYDYMFAPDTGDITLIDTDGTGGIDVVIIMDYDDIIVESVSADDMKIFDKLTDDVINWSNAKYADFYCSTYREVTPFDIYAGDVVSVARSVDGKCFTFMVSRTAVIGTIDQIDGNRAFVILDGEKYYLSDTFFDTSFVSAGDTGTLYLNIDGKGVYFEHDAATAFTVAYLIDSEEFGGLDNRVWLQLFDGEVKALPCASLIKINDTVYKNNTSVNVLKGYRDIFEYKLNSNGEISYILFPREDNIDYNNNSLAKMGGYVGGTYYKSETRSFSGFLLADKNVKVFLVPLDRSRTDAYFLTDISYFRNDVMYYSLSGYSRGGNVETAEYIVSEFDTYPQYQLESPCLLEKVTAVLTDDGETAEMITVRYNGSDIRELVLNDECALEGAVPGDVIQYSVNLDGLVHAVLPVFDNGDNYLYHYGNTYYTASCRMVYGTVKEMRKSSFILERAGGGEEIVTLGYPIVIYDSASRGDKVKVGSYADIKDYLHYGADADEVLIRFDYGVPREMIIYR